MNNKIPLKTKRFPRCQKEPWKKADESWYDRSAEAKLAISLQCKVSLFTTLACTWWWWWWWWWWRPLPKDVALKLVIFRGTPAFMTLEPLAVRDHSPLRTLHWRWSLPFEPARQYSVLRDFSGFEAKANLKEVSVDFSYNFMLKLGQLVILSLVAASCIRGWTTRLVVSP